MPKYLDGAGLSHFWESIKPKLGGVVQSGSGTVVTSDDAANLPPLSLTIHGKSVQDGTPTPSVPVPIKSIEAAENILDISKFTKNTTNYAGCTITNNGDGSWTLSGTNAGSSAWGFNSTVGSQTLPAGTYTLSSGGTLEGCYFRVIIGGVSYQSAGEAVTFTLDSAKNITQWIVTVYANATISGTVRPTIMEGDIKGDVVVCMHAGSDADITGTPTSTAIIDLNGYKVCSVPDGTEDIITVDSEGNVTLTKNTLYSVFDGSENWVKYSTWDANGQYCYYLYRLDTIWANAGVVCVLSDQLAGVGRNAFTTTNPINAITLSGGGYETTVRVPQATLAEWKAYLAEHPLTVIAHAKEPQTISLGKIDLPSLPSPSFSMHVEALVTPTLDAEWFTEDIGRAVETVSARIAALEADVTELQGQVPEREVLYDTSTWTIIRYGRTVMVQVHGATATPSTSTALVTGILADYKPAYNCSATVLTSSGSSTQAARMAVYADTGNVYIVPAGYSSSASWYGTLTYIY